MGLVPCIAVSTGYVLLTCIIAEVLRRLVGQTVPNGLLKSALLEIIAGAELCGTGFELIISKSPNLSVQFENTSMTQNAKIVECKDVHYENSITKPPVD